MQRITNDQYLNLTPSSMQAGNTTADNHTSTMTGRGSQSSLPVPDRQDLIPMPVIYGQHDAVYGVDHRPHPGHPGAGTGPQPDGVGGSWREVTETGNGGWKQL